ncbi:MAG: septum formation initiator family protein [Thermodesulfovibrionales bacterium]|nr:septum formation initiator family protein [Thermodesulfovibrionales bacterium]
MRQKVKNFRQQADSERKKRDIFFLLIVSLAFLYIIVSFVYGERGLIKYYELKKVERDLQAEIEALQKGNEKLRAEIEALSKDSFLKEKYARENFGLAKPEEYIYQFKEDEKR